MHVRIGLYFFLLYYIYLPNLTTHTLWNYYFQSEEWDGLGLNHPQYRINMLAMNEQIKYHLKQAMYDINYIRIIFFKNI